MGNMQHYDWVAIAGRATRMMNYRVNEGGAWNGLLIVSSNDVSTSRYRRRTYVCDVSKSKVCMMCEATQ